MLPNSMFLGSSSVNCSRCHSEAIKQWYHFYTVSSVILLIIFGRILPTTVDNTKASQHLHKKDFLLYILLTGDRKVSNNRLKESNM